MSYDIYIGEAVTETFEGHRTVGVAHVELDDAPHFVGDELTARKTG